MTLHILATGTSRGIGAAIAAGFADTPDIRFVGHATRPAPGILAADLALADGADRLWDAALAALDGRIDVLVNNAGIFEAAALDAADADWADVWARTMQVNLTASSALSRRAIAHWRQRASGGRIVNVASRAAYRGDSPAHWHYAASKAGMVAVTKTIARGYAREGIYAFAVCPGFTMTGMAEEYLASRGGDALLRDIPLGRVAEPEEVARTVRFLALEAPPSMTGAVIDVNGASHVR
ncbi:MAG: SDR family oxidoreductase [Sphingomonas sp.]